MTLEVDLDYPTIVHIETWAQCNAACVFCPYPTLERKGIKMSDELIQKILTDLEDIPRPFYLSPFKVNEPFLDKRMLPLLDEITERLPHAIIRLFSNGSAITEDKADHIAALPRVQHLWISLNDYRENAYQETMKIPMGPTLKRLDYIHKQKQAGEFPHKVIVSRVADGSIHDTLFVHWLLDKYPGFEPAVIKRDSWLGFHEHEAIRTEVPQTKCSRWYEIDITSTGVVSLCCMDGRCEYPTGDVSKQHVLEVFNSPNFRRMRAGRDHRQAYEPCNRCTY